MGRVVIGSLGVLAVGLVLWLFVFDGSFGSARDAAEEERQAANRAALQGRQRVLEENTAAVPVQAAHIRGVVVDGAGRPLSGVPVGAMVLPNRRDRDYDWIRIQIENGLKPPQTESAIVANATTDDVGRFKLTGLIDARWYTVVARPQRPLGVTQAPAGASYSGPAVRLVARPGARLRGRVVNAAGKGVAAWISGFVQVNNRTPQASGNWQVSRIQTAADGSFRLDEAPAGELRLTVLVPGVVKLSHVAVRSPSDEVVLIRIGGSASVAGVVRNTAGDPVAGARVAVNTTASATRAWTHMMMRQVTTDAQGAFRVEGMLAGRLQSLMVVADGYISSGPSGLNIPLPAGGSTDVDVTLVKGGTIRGRVLDEGGAGVAAARVIWARSNERSRHVNELRAQTTTAEDGSFVLAGVSPGRGHLHALCAAHYQPLPDVSGRNGRQLESSVPIELEPEGATLAKDIIVRTGTALTGVVTDEDGAVVRSALVHAAARAMPYLGLQAEPRVAETDADGAFVLPALTPGVAWAVTAYHAGRRSVTTLVNIDGDDENRCDLVVHRPAALAGKVASPAGDPIPNTQIVIRPDGGRQVWGTTDANGAFRFDGLSAGIYLISQSGAYGASLPGQGSENVALKWGELREGIVLTSEATLTLAGVVVGSNGEPVPSVNVMAQSTDRSAFGFWVGTTGPDGAFEIKGLPSGEKSLRVESEQLNAMYEAGDTDLRIVYDPPKMLNVIGRLFDADGQPIGTADVQVLNSTGNSYGAQVANGRFSAEVPANFEPYSLTVRSAHDAAGRPLNLRPVIAQPIDPSSGVLEIRLERGNVVSGRVADGDGNGVVGTSVTARAKDTSGGRWYEKEARTGSDGTFAFVGLDDAEVVLSVAPSGHWMAVPTQTVKPGTEEVAFVLERGVAIEGRVVDKEGNGLQASIQGQLSQASRDALKDKRHLSQRGFSTVSDASGAFRFSGVPPGITVRLTVRFVPHGPQRAGYVTETLDDVSAGATGVVVTLERGVYIEGKVVDSDGQPAWNVQIEAKAVDGKGEFHASVYQSPGTFRLGPVRPGRYELTYYSYNVSRFKERKPIVVDAPSDGLVLQVLKAFPAKGRVVGKNLAGFSVKFISDGGSHGTGINNSGAFEIRRADDEPGTIFVHSASDDRYALLEDVRPSHGPFTIQLEEGLAIEGRIEGLPEDLPRSTIRARSGPVRADGVVSKDGTFRIPGLPPGDYILRGSVRGGRVDVPREAIAAGTRGVVLQFVKRDGSK